MTPGMDALLDEQKARVHALWEKWKTVLYLNPWTLQNEYYVGNFAEARSGGSAIAEAAARTHVDWPYLEATIEWNVTVIADMDDERLEYVYLHECMHMLLNEMREDRADPDGTIHHEERVATMLAHIIQGLAPEKVTPCP